MIVVENLIKSYKKKSLNKVVLDRITFYINSHEKVAILGRNGSGKTTLLRLISGSLEKTSGNLEVRGNVYPLMGIGLGINEKFTGYENIRCSLVYNGFDLSRQKVLEIEKDIEDFTELGEFLNKPFYTYSLGMKMRLMFAIATAVNPDIFLIDEVLGAGDFYFTLKSQERLNRIIEKNASTLILVSHSTQLLKKFCDRGIWIKDGKIFLDSNINEVCSAYEAYIERISSGDIDEFQSINDLRTETSNGHEFYPWQNNNALILIEDFIIITENDKINFLLKLYSKKKEVFSVRIIFTFWSKKGDRVARFENDVNNIDFCLKSTLNIESVIKKTHIPSGEFDITVSIFENNKNSFARENLERLSAASNVGTIKNDDKSGLSNNVLPHLWSIG